MKIIIAHFGTYYVNTSGGVEKVTCNLANALVRRGHEVTILYRDKVEGKPYFPLDERVKQYNILFENGKKVVSDKPPLRIRLYREAARLFSQRKAQGINVWYKGKQYGPRIKEYLDNHPADLILSCSIPSAKYVIEDAGCTLPVIEMIHSHPQVQFPDLSEAEKKATVKCRAMQILVPSDLNMAHQYFPELPVTVIGNAVFPASKPADLAAPRKVHKVICVGNISGRKNQLMLAKAFASLSKDFPDWQLEFWGDDSSHYAGQMKQWIRHSKSGENIRVMGKTSHIDDVYAASDIICMPSRDEGFPLALTEAMAAGLPAVGFSDSTGVSDIIEDGVDGFLVPRSEKNLAGALKKLMDDRELRIKMGQSGMKAMKQYAPEHIWDQWEELCQHVLDNEKTGH